MSQLKDVSPIEQDQFQHGLIQLKSRRNKMRMYMMTSLIVTLMMSVILFNYQSLVYAFFEISPTVQMLHVPYSAEIIQKRIGDSQDYFGNLLMWVMWLGLKITVSFIGATLFVYYAKKLSFIKNKLKGFVQTTLAWLISIIVIWMTLVWVHSEVIEVEHHNSRYAEAVEYRNNIQQSKIYRYIYTAELEQPVADYLLAQTALLHRPVDTDTALAYISKLVNEEQKNPNFVAYGFKPEQLWAMQRQVYGKAATALAQSAENQMKQADTMAYYAQIVLSILIACFFAMMLLFSVLNWQLTKRLKRIDTQMN